MDFCFGRKKLLSQLFVLCFQHGKKIGHGESNEARLKSIIKLFSINNDETEGFAIAIVHSIATSV